MALNFTTSYVYAPNTTIASAQVNTNFSDIANVFTGLEALTKTFAKLKVDVDPSTALEVATKQYVDHYSTWRRPNLQYVSASTVTIETGTSGAATATVLFPDGSVRTDVTSSHIVFDITRNAAYSGTKQSGLRTGSVANNTWYAIYAVKASDNSTDFVASGDTVLPLVANFATLNSNYGTSSWVYLGMIRYGDQSATANAILNFFQSGSQTIFLNACVGSVNNQAGIRLATASAAGTVSWAYAAGTSGAVVPSTVFMGYVGVSTNAAATQGCRLDSSSAANGNAICRLGGNSSVSIAQGSLLSGLTLGLSATLTSSTGNFDLYLNGFIDNALGVGSNPLL